MQTLPVSELKVHPQNNYFFDDMGGEAWDKFLESIRERGIRDPILVTQDNVIVSGHQRLRAAKELKMENVPIIKREYCSPDDILRDLIELNIRQRGIMADSETKAGRRFKELKRIYGIKNGGDRKSESQVETLKSMDELAEENGVSRARMYRTIQVANADEELQSLNINGKITGDTVRYMMSKLSPEERRKFLAEKSSEEKITKSDVAEYQRQIAELSKVNKDLSQKYEDLLIENEELKTSPSVTYSETAQEVNAAYSFWKSADKYTKEILSPMLYNDVLIGNANNGCSEYIIKACNLLIDAASDILRRTNTHDVIIDN